MKIRMIARSGEAGSSASHAKAVESLARFATQTDIDEALFSDAFLANWLVQSSVDGLSLKTATHYLGILAALCRRIPGGCGVTPEEFKRLKAEANALGDHGWRAQLFQRDLDQLAGMTSTPSVDDDVSLVSDLIITMLQTGSTTLAQAASVKTAELTETTETLREIIGRRAQAKRRYLFPLDQSVKTPATLSRQIESLVRRVFVSRGIKPAGSVDDTLRSYFALGALSQGITPGETLALLGSAPAGIPSLKLARPSVLSPQQKQTIRLRIVDILASAPPKWYVMRLRFRVTYDKLLDRIAHLPEAIRRPTLFYPCDEIMRKVGSRKVTGLQSVLPDIVFFRCHVNDILPLFRNIGDIAWCYRTGGPHDGVYASVPPQEFERFQRTIGHFTPGFEVTPIGTIPVTPDHRVVVLGGLFQGFPAQFESVIDSPDQGVIYRLRLMGDNGLEWLVRMDPRMVEPHTGMA